MSAENVVINFVGDASELKPVENVLEGIVQKGGEVGAAWGKTAEKITAGNKNAAESTTKLSKSLDALAVATKSADKAAIGGAYKEYLKQIQLQLGLTSKELTAYVQNARKAAQAEIFTAGTDEEVDQLALSIEVMNEQLKEFGVTEFQTEEKSKSLKAQLRAMKEELAGLDEGTAAFEELKQRAGELDDKIKDVNDTISRTGSDTRNIDGLIDLAGGVAGGFALAQGAAALFGEGEEEVQKALLKVNAAMSILQGLQQIQNVLQKESAASLLLTKVFYQQNTAAIVENTTAGDANVVTNITQAASAEGVAVAEGAQTIATEAATVATAELNTVMSLNPAAIIVTAVVALTAALVYFSLNNNKAAESQAILNNELDKATLYLDSNLKLLDQQTAKQVALAKQKGTSVSALSKLEGEAGNQRLKQINDEINAASKLYNETIAQDKETLEAKGKLYDKLFELENKYQDERRALEVKAIEYRTTLAEEELKSFTGFQQAKVAATRAGSDGERSAQVSAIRAIASEREKSADYIALTDGEKAQQRAEDEKQIQGLQLANYQHYLAGRTALYDSYIAKAKLSIILNETDSIKSINAVTDFEIAALKKRRDAALKGDPNKNNGQAQQIIAETNLQIAELEKQKEVKLLEIRKAGINAQVIAAEKGTQEEFDYKLLALENQRAIDLSATELTQEQITEITRKFLRARDDLKRVFDEAQLQNQISLANAELDAFGLLENNKLDITLARLEKQRELEISQAEENAAKIAEINAKFDKQIIENKKATINTILASNLNTLDIFSAQSKAASERTLSLEQSTFTQKVAASKSLLKEEIDRLELEHKALTDQVEQNLITNEEFNLKYQDILNRRAVATQKSEEQITAATIKEIQTRYNVIQGAFDVFQKGLNATLGDTAFTKAIAGFQNLGNATQDILEKIKAGTISSAEGLKEFAKLSIGVVQDIANQAFSESAAKRQEQLSSTISDLEEQKAAELNVKNNTEQQKADIDRKYKALEKQEKIKAFEADKNAKKQQAVINGALAVAQAFASNPFPYSVIVAAIVAASTAVQVAKIASTPVPKFKKGKVDIQGPGSTTSDSIHAMISNRESVINAQSTAKWKDALMAINSDKFEPWLMSKFQDFTFPKTPDVPLRTAGTIDYDRFADAVAKKMRGVIPGDKSTHVTIDKDGIRTLVVTEGGKTEIKNKYFSMS